MNNANITENIKKNVIFTLEQLSNSKTISREGVQQKKTILDSVQRLVDLYLKNVEPVIVNSPATGANYRFFNDKDTEFITYIQDELEKEILRTGNLMNSLQQGKDHREFRDTVMCYEKSVTIRKKVNEELLYSNDRKQYVAKVKVNNETTN